MLRPAVNEILKDGQSYYSLVIAVAQTGTPDCPRQKKSILY